MPTSRIARAATKLLHGTGVILFVGMCLLVLAQVVARKFFEPLIWSEELARYTFIWVCFLGWVISTQKKSHIRISFVTDRAGPRLKLFLGLFADLAVIAFALIDPACLAVLTQAHCLRGIAEVPSWSQLCRY